jgi:alpha-glucosidase
MTAISHYLFSAAPGDLSLQAIATDAIHYGGRTELEMHNLFGHLMSRAANLAVRDLHQGKRPFLISRSTFAGSGRWTGHWVRGIFLGD